MSNIINADGITIKTLTELINELTAGMKLIYGDDINVASDSPDGQLINLFSRVTKDLEDLLVSIYNSFDPDLAIGVTLDERVAINGIQRLGGTFTITPITVVTDRALNLSGLDSEINNPDGTGYTIADNQGNNFVLTASTSIPSAGTYVFNFRSQNSGAIETLVNTITTQVTVTLGVVSVNNPSTYTTLGLDQESDADLKLRRQRSVSLASQGYNESLTAELLNISGVTYAKVYENKTNVTNSDGMISHSIWAIVEGGADSDIAYAIYTKLNAGAGMKGDEIILVQQPDGTYVEIYFDRVITESVHIKFDAESINGIDVIDSTYIKQQLVLLVGLDVYEALNVNDIASLIRTIDSNCLATDIQVSSNGSTWLNIVSPTAKNKRFTLIEANIGITVL